MIDQYLIKYARKFLKDHFNIELKIPIERNNRLRSTLGRYISDVKGNPVRIELSGNLLTYGTEKTILGVLKHECIHYAYHLQGKDMRDGNPAFERTLQQFHAPSTHTLKVGKYYTYQCTNCKQTGESRLQRLARYPNEYRTNCCRSPLTITGEKIYRGSIDEQE